MAIMATGMVMELKIKKLFILFCSIFTLPSLSGEWQFAPSISTEETYTDNIERVVVEPTASFVNQLMAGLNAEYQSNLAALSFSGSKSYMFYSHDSEINDDFRSLSTTGSYSVWRNGPTLVASASIANISGNNASNSLADLVSGDTIERRSQSGGVEYNFGNTSYSVKSSVIYSRIRYEDGLSDSEGFTAIFNSQNGNNARSVYWQLDSRFTKRTQGASDGENYTVNALIGAMTSFNLNPFVRFYDEQLSGTIANNNRQTTPSWGPGVRWLTSPHLIIDLSYNFVADETISEDYVAANFDWSPSARTSLSAGYSKRFFGDSYDFSFNHRNRRLTNNISYNESLESFDRNNFQAEDDGLELIESNEFSLNKRLSWQSTLQLSRTSFGIIISTNERTGLEKDVVDNYLNAGLTITRTISPKSSLSLSTTFRFNEFDKDNPEGSRQTDYYRTNMMTYSKNLALSLFTSFALQHVNRDSTIDKYSYDEMRAVINITKDF
jgi:hypothetical protein